jgi:hypothetical protein
MGPPPSRLNLRPRRGVPMLSNNTQRAIRNQTGLNLAALACALERYWLANKEYPGQLDQLVPQFISKLPHEIATGDPLKYRRTDDGRYVLYSTGLDGQDFGGASHNSKGQPTGNWVWAYPATLRYSAEGTH